MRIVGGVVMALAGRRRSVAITPSAPCDLVTSLIASSTRDTRDVR